MGKRRYIKNSNGVTMSVTTDTLGLEKPLLNENYDIDVHNRNMDRIDEDLTPIEDSYIIGLFQHDGDITHPRDYYTKEESDNLFVLKTEIESAIKPDITALRQAINENKASILDNSELINNLNVEINGQRLRGINIANALIDKIEG